MRRLYLTLAGLCWLGLGGCHHYCSHGVCDCVMDDHCLTRAPWVHNYGAPPIVDGPVGPVDGAPLAAPMPAAPMPAAPTPPSDVTPKKL
jgi:hypothetical protein